jgi:hypothetical protein
MQTIGKYFDLYFGPEKVRKIELLILRAAIISFLVHLLVIFLGNNFGLLHHNQENYLKAIYTPFSFILYYEVFLLIIIIPKSISEFIGKQFEVITLITLRSFFHDIADFNSSDFIAINSPEITSLLYDLGAALTLLTLTILYYKIYYSNKKKEVVTELKDFILIKKNVSFGMIIVLFLLSVSSLLNWSNDVLYAFQNNTNYPNPNTVFYTDFFSIMILVDVLLLIISFVYNFSFFTIFRNASFIITTILIRLSLTIAKPMNYFMVIIGFLFSVITFYLFSHRNSKKIE